MIAQYLIASETFAFDEGTGRLSVFHILDKIQIASSPFLLQNIYLSALFEKEQNAPDGNESCDAFIRINGKLLSQTVFTVNFDGTRVNRCFTNIQSLMVPEAGNLEFSVESNSKILGKWSVGVILVGSPSAVSGKKKMPVHTSSKKKEILPIKAPLLLQNHRANI